MQKDKKSLKVRAFELLNHCLKNNEWSPDTSTSAVVAFSDASYDTDDLETVWHMETVNDILYKLLDDYREKLSGTKPPVSDENASSFTQLFCDTLRANVADHWLITPIHRAKISNLIEFGDYLFIPDAFPRNEKLRILAEKSKITMEDMVWRAEHTEKTRSPNFYNYSLMCRKINHQTSFVNFISNRVVLLDFAILRVLKYATELDVQSPFHSITISEYRRAENMHLVINAQSSSKWGHSPIWSDAHTTTLVGNLNWLHDQVVQNEMMALENSIGYLHQIDRLSFRFRRAAMFYSKAVDMQLASRKRSFEGYGLELLHLMIAAESLLLDRESEKRLRLATLISRLVDIENHSQREVFESFDTCYNLRSDYVHSGDDIFPEYNENFEDGQIKQNIYIVRHAVAKIICDAPRYLALAKQLAQSDNKTNAEKAWFVHLDNIWKGVLSGSIH